MCADTPEEKIRKQQEKRRKQVAVAPEIMKATEYLARIQAESPHIADKKGFGTAHYGLGLVLVAMWRAAQNDDERLEIAKAAAFLLWKHKAQANNRGVTETMIGLFLSGISRWSSSRQNDESDRIRDFCSGKLTWTINDQHTRLVVVAVGTDAKAIAMLEAAARHCGLQVDNLFGSKVLVVPKESISQLIQFAASHTAFRGMLPVGEKMSFDVLSLEFPASAPGKAGGAAQLQASRPEAPSSHAQDASDGRLRAVWPNGDLNKASTRITAADATSPGKIQPAAPQLSWWKRIMRALGFSD